MNLANLPVWCLGDTTPQKREASDFHGNTVLGKLYRFLRHYVPYWVVLGVGWSVYGWSTHKANNGPACGRYGIDEFTPCLDSIVRVVCSKRSY